MGFGEEEKGKKRKKMMGLWEGSASPRLGRRNPKKMKNEEEEGWREFRWLKKEGGRRRFCK